MSRTHSRIKINQVVKKSQTKVPEEFITGLTPVLKRAPFIFERAANPEIHANIPKKKVSQKVNKSMRQSMIHVR